MDNPLDYIIYSKRPIAFLFGAGAEVAIAVVVDGEALFLGVPEQLEAAFV